jgi:hypothetical protein
MTFEELEATPCPWEFRAVSPVSHLQALTYAWCKDLRVQLPKTEKTGEFRWLIRVVDEDGSGEFWMDAKLTRNEAVVLRRRMGWRVSG